MLNTVIEAVNLSLEKHFLPAMIEYDHHVWRTERYYNENVDNFLKAFLPYFDAIYRCWAPLKTPGVKEYIIIFYLGLGWN